MKPMLHPLHTPRVDQEDVDQRFAHVLRAALAVAALAALTALLLLAGLAEVSADAAPQAAPAFKSVAPLEAPAA